MTQLNEYNGEYGKCKYTKPTLDLFWAQKNWAWLTSEMTPEQLADFEQARDELVQYEKIYSIVEYASDLNEGMTVLERKIMSNNVTIPMNFYRGCRANSQANLFPELEMYMKAYYDLLDDCEHLPLWKRKLEEDLGGVVSFLGIEIEEAARDLAIEMSPVYARFDADK